MRKPLRTDDHARLRALLREARTRAGLTQTQVAERLGTPQSFVAKYEGGERRLDVIEFIAVTRALGGDPVQLLQALIGTEGAEVAALTAEDVADGEPSMAGLDTSLARRPRRRSSKQRR